MAISELQKRTPGGARGTPLRLWIAQQRLWECERDRELYRAQVIAEEKRLEAEQREAAERRRKGKR
jgi:hypothetical protein